MPASTPYREQRGQEVCQKRILLPVPEIEEDGAEISHRTCSRLTGERCPRCGLPLCPEHIPEPSHRCDPCEAEFQGRLAAAQRDAALLEPVQRAIRLALVVSLSALAVLILWLTRHQAGSARPVWFVVPALLLYVALCAAFPIAQDRAARRHRSRARREFLRESAREPDGQA